MFNRFDICEAYYVAEMLWNVSGMLQERPSNQRRRESCGVQLNRLQFKPAPGLDSIEDLTENGREIYFELINRLGLCDHPDAERKGRRFICTECGTEIEA